MTSYSKILSSRNVAKLPQSSLLNILLVAIQIFWHPLGLLLLNTIYTQVKYKFLWSVCNTKYKGVCYTQVIFKDIKNHAFFFQPQPHELLGCQCAELSTILLHLSWLCAWGWSLWMVSHCVHHVACLRPFNLAEPIPHQARPQPMFFN